MINLYLGAKILNSFNPAKYFAFFLLFLKDCRDNKPRQPFSDTFSWSCNQGSGLPR